MMKIHMKAYLGATAVAAIVLLSSQFAAAGTIIKLSLGDTGPDVEYSGGLGGILSTVDDNDNTTTGEQNTDVEFVGDLSFLPSIVLPTASYTLNGLTAAGPASAVNGQVGQLFNGGTFELYDSSNALLLSANVTSSAFSGFVGSNSGAEFTINDSIITGGSLALYLPTGLVDFSIGLNGINGAAGLAITPLGPPIIAPPFTIVPATIDAFTASGTKIIGSDAVVPEPGTGVMLLVAGLLASTLLHRAN